MPTVSQLNETDRQERIVVNVESHRFYHTTWPLRCEDRILGCSVAMGTIPPGLKLQRRRSLFSLSGVALHSGEWSGILCVDTEKGQRHIPLVFVVQ